MARPVTWNDLAAHEKRGDEVARWSSYNAMGFPTVAKHLIAAAEAAQKIGLVVSNDGIFEQLSNERLENNLVQAQERWDVLEQKYRVAQDFQSPNSELWQINNWAKENGLPTIKPMES